LRKASGLAPLQLVNKYRERTVENQREISVWHDVPEEVTGFVKPRVRLGADCDPQQEAADSEGRDHVVATWRL
jgi:hypothetical protein